MCININFFQESGEKPETMSHKDAAMFPLIASAALFGLYLFFQVSGFKEHMCYYLSISTLRTTLLPHVRELIFLHSASIYLFLFIAVRF